jgi:hypothetical protein
MGSPRPHRRRDCLGSSRPHRRRDCLGSHRPQLRKDWARPTHIGAGTGRPAPTSAPGQDWAYAQRKPDELCGGEADDRRVVDVVPCAQVRQRGIITALCTYKNVCIRSTSSGCCDLCDSATWNYDCALQNCSALQLRSMLGHSGTAQRSRTGWHRADGNHRARAGCVRSLARVSCFFRRSPPRACVCLRTFRHGLIPRPDRQP